MFIIIVSTYLMFIEYNECIQTLIFSGQCACLVEPEWSGPVWVQPQRVVGTLPQLLPIRSSQ